MNYLLPPVASFALLLCASALSSAPSDYRPFLPAPGPETKAIVSVDFRWQVDNAKGDKLVVLAAANALQGLINRENETKIFISNPPVRVIGDGINPQEVEFLKPGSPERHSASDAMLEIMPVEVSKIDLATAKRPDGSLYSDLEIPLLSYLIDYAQAEGVLSGKVALYSNNGWWDKATAGQRGAAIAVASFENALLANENLLRYIQGHHRDVFKNGEPEIIDVRQFMPADKDDWSANINAMKWMVDRYAKDILPGVNDDIDVEAYNKLRNKTLVMVAPSGGNPPCAIDYMVAARTLNYYLEFPSDYSKSPYLDDLAALFNTDNYPVGIPQWGEVETSHLNVAAAHYGYSAMHGQIPNCSATASFSHNPENFRPLTPGKELPLDPKVVYISGNGPDGDALDFFYYGGFRSLYYDVASGEVPNGWRVNPILIELNPPMWEWLSKQNPDTVELVPSMNDGGFPKSLEGQQAWLDIYQNYLDGSNGSFVGINILAPWTMRDNPFHTYLKQMDLSYVIVGYQGDQRITQNLYDVLDDTLYLDQVTWRGHPKEITASHEDVTADIKQMKNIILKHKKDDAPYFMFARYTGETGQNFPSILKRTRYELVNDPELKAAGLDVRFVLPKDFSATYKAWAAKN